MFRILTVLALAASLGTPAWAQTQISACGQSVPARGSGVLVADLTCTPSDVFAVGVGDRGKLDLAGHTVSGGVTGVSCTGKCIVGSSSGPATIRDAKYGLNVLGRVGKPSNLVFENNEFGILSDYSQTLLRGDHVTIDGGWGIQAKKVRISALTITAGFPGIQADRVVLDGASITGCPGYGIRSNLARLTNSTVTGNTPVDLETLRRPILINSLCDHSDNLANPTQNWGVCSGD